MTLLVNFAPVSVPNSTIATVQEASKEQAVSENPASTSQDDTATQSTDSSTSSGVPVNTRPTTSGNGTVTPTVTATPSTPGETEPVVTTPDVIPAVPVDDGQDNSGSPLIDIPVVTPLIDTLFAEGE